jgi:hypothetical protein
VVVPKRFPTSATVNSVVSMPYSIGTKIPPDQGVNIKMSVFWTIILYIRIAIYQKISKIPKISFQELDRPLCLGYIIYMSVNRTFKQASGSPGSRMALYRGQRRI